MATIQQLDSGRSNNFDLLRFVAATIVIFSHSFLVTGTFGDEPLVKLTHLLDLGAVGVRVFFAISGYLITKSMFRQPSIGSFVWARCLRIFPGLMITALFCAFIIGPLCTTLPINDYFRDIAVYKFIFRLSTLHNFDNYLPGTFVKNPFPYSVNSPVWTLPAELVMYVAVLVVEIIRLAVKKEFNPLYQAVPALIFVYVFFRGMRFDALYLHQVYLWGIAFLSGSIIWFLRHKLLLSVKAFLITAVLFIVAVIMFKDLQPRYNDYITSILSVMLAYGILVAAYHPRLQLTGFHKLGDYSYGLYIYAFPIQQFIVFKFHLLNPFLHFLISFPLALTLAIPSWHFIEKPILKLKRVSFFKR